MKIVKRIAFIILVFIIAALYSYGVWPRAIYDTDIGANSYENTGALTANEVLEQRFKCSDKGLCGMTIKLTKQDNQMIGTYEWTLREVDTNQLVGEGIIDEASTENKEFVSSSAQKRGNIELSFPIQNDSAGKEYLLTIQGKDIQENETMAVYITEKGDTDSSLSVSGEDLEKSTVIKLNYKRFSVETFIVFLAIMIYIVVFIKFMYKLFK